MGTRLKQCAWCRREYDDLGPVGEPLAQLSPDASHGVCVDCVRSLLRQEAERCRAGDDLAGAVAAERQRLRLLRSVTRLRVRARISRTAQLRRDAARLLAESTTMVEAWRQHRPPA